MKAKSMEEAWKLANEIFPTDYEKDEASSQRAGYPIFRSTAEGRYYDYICDLNDRLEINLADGNRTINIWIEADPEPEEPEIINLEERKQVIGRIQRLTYWYTKEYTEELENKKAEDKAVEEMQARKNEDGKIEMMVLTAENNAKVMLSCITECIQAVEILKNPKEDVELWMLAGINAMLDKANEMKVIPYDLPTSICGLLCSQFR